MDKDQVIKMRNALKAGKNWPVIVYIDNLFKKIDESNALQFTKWDDDNGILYHYSLTDPNLDTSPSNIGGTVSLFATDYEMIQAMEVVCIQPKDLATSIDALECIGEDFKERIINGLNKALNPNLVNFSRTDINKIMMLADGHKALDDSDDYYAGRYAQSFAETRPMAERNAYAAKKAAEEANKTSN